MLKLAWLLLILANAGLVSGIICPLKPISPADLPANFPIGAQNITTIDKGTNCTVQFTIPNNYVLLVKFSVDFESTDDTVIIFDDKNQPAYNLLHTGTTFYDSPFWFPATSAAVQIVSVSGKTRFMMSYSFQVLTNFQRVSKNTGDYFPASSITGNTFTTITASSANEKVVVSFGQKAGEKLDPLLTEYFVYDGDNINTAPYLGRLDKLGPKLTVSSGRSLSIVNFFGSKSTAYVLGNDASTVSGFSKYGVVLTNLQYQTNGTIRDLSNNGAAVTYICLDCSAFYYTSLYFDSLGIYSNAGYMSFQGQTPTHKREKLIRYESMAFVSNQLPQMIPSNVFTVTTYLTTVSYSFNTGKDYSGWQKPYIGRKGYLFSPSLWNSAAANKFDYEFRDNSQLYNFTLNMMKMSFSDNTNQMMVKIGSGTTGNPSVDNEYPRDKSSNGKLMANGNYMEIGLIASPQTDVRLSFEMQKVSSASAVGVFVSMIFALFYTI